MRFEWSHFSWSFLYWEVLESVGEEGFSILNARSRSMQPRIICMFSFQSLKFAPLRIGTEFRLADIEATTENTLEVPSLLLVGVLFYGTQQSPLRCLSFYGLIKGTGCLLLTKMLFWTRVPSTLYVQMRLSQMLICSFLAGNLSKFGLIFVIWLLFAGVSLLCSALLTL